MKIVALVLILVAALFNAGATVLLKNFSMHHSFMHLFLSILFYSLNFLFFYLALKTINISIAYPLLVALSVIMIIISSMFFFNEKIVIETIFGIAFILVGVYLIYQNY